jgi:hypothetical protein
LQIKAAELAATLVEKGKLRNSMNAILIDAGILQVSSYLMVFLVVFIIDFFLNFYLSLLLQSSIIDESFFIILLLGLEEVEEEERMASIESGRNRDSSS